MGAQAGSRSQDQYAASAIVLHWAIALAIFGMIPLGWWMADAIKEPETQSQAYAAFQLHKSIGLTILLLSLARLGVRLVNPPPSLPASVVGWQRTASHAVHGLLYVVMIAAPLTGWIYVSSGFTQDGRRLDVPTQYFGLFQWPHLPVPEVPALAAASMSAHSALAWGAILLGAAHAAAALKHHFLDRDVVLARMVPGLASPDGAASPSTPDRRRALGVGFGLIAVAVIAVMATLATLPGPAPAATAEAVAPATTPNTPLAAAPTETEIAASAAAPLTASDPAPGAPAAPGPAASARPPTDWTIDPRASEVGFSGTHAGAAFSGRFERWSATIRFSPESLAAARAVVTFETASARTGDATRDAALPGAEWFDAKRHPNARFETRAFRALGGGRFEADGTLTIKGKSVPVTLPFTFKETNGRAEVAGALTLDRIALGLGLESDANAQWVSREIKVTIRVAADPA